MTGKFGESVLSHSHQIGNWVQMPNKWISWYENWIKILLLILNKLTFFSLSIICAKLGGDGIFCRLNNFFGGVALPKILGKSWKFSLPSTPPLTIWRLVTWYQRLLSPHHKKIYMYKIRRLCAFYITYLESALTFEMALVYPFSIFNWIIWNTFSSQTKLN